MDSRESGNPIVRSGLFKIEFQKTGVYSVFFYYQFDIDFIIIMI
jgi:hypothetical protein